MNTFWMTLLISAVKAIAGSAVWDSALKVVTLLLDSDLSGDEKRAIAISELKLAFKDAPNRLLNLVIEVAVTKAVSK